MPGWRYNCDYQQHVTKTSELQDKVPHIIPTAIHPERRLITNKRICAVCVSTSLLTAPKARGHDLSKPARTDTQQISVGLRPFLAVPRGTVNCIHVLRIVRLRWRRRKPGDLSPRRFNTLANSVSHTRSASGQPCGARWISIPCSIGPLTRFEGKQK